jgi:hypothetical protein
MAPAMPYESLQQNQVDFDVRFPLFFRQLDGPLPRQGMGAKLQTEGLRRDVAEAFRRSYRRRIGGMFRGNESEQTTEPITRNDRRVIRGFLQIQT